MLLRFVALVLTLGFVAGAQQLDLQDYLRRVKTAAGLTLEDKIENLANSGVTISGRGLRELDRLTSPLPTVSSGSPQLRSEDGKFLGNLNANRYDPDSVSNPFGLYGSEFSPDSVNNSFGMHGSRFSPQSANNPYATQAPKIVTPDGNYLGRFSTNPFDPDSISNRFGRYGSPFSPDSINNPFGVYGSPYSPQGARNPYGIGVPRQPALPSLPPLPKLPALPSLFDR